MQEKFPHLNSNERLKAENEFLKMKLMLERGGYFGGEENGELPPEVENQFLNNILAFEEQFDQHKIIKVFDKIGKPQQFKPVAEILDSEIGQAWEELDTYMLERGITLECCNPKISPKELYRFATEELFNHDVEDINLPGLCMNFIYDEFYPDPVYENSILVKQELFSDIFSQNDLFYDLHFANDGFLFNNAPYDFARFSEMINRFKSLFEEIELRSFTINTCEVEADHCKVRGEYDVTAKINGNEWSCSGNYDVELISADSRYWYFKNICIEGFNPE